MAQPHMTAEQRQEQVKQVDELMVSGMTRDQACAQVGITKTNYYWIKQGKARAAARLAENPRVRTRKPAVVKISDIPTAEAPSKPSFCVNMPSGMVMLAGKTQAIAELMGYLQ